MIDCEYTKEITCPWCGYKEGGSWEYEGNEGNIDCPECGKEFIYYRDFDITYITEKIGDKK